MKERWTTGLWKSCGWERRPTTPPRSTELADFCTSFRPLNNESGLLSLTPPPTSWVVSQPPATRLALVSANQDMADCFLTVLFSSSFLLSLLLWSRRSSLGHAFAAMAFWGFTKRRFGVELKKKKQVLVSRIGIIRTFILSGRTTSFI